MSSESPGLSVKTVLLLSGYLFAVLLLVHGYVFGYGDLEEMNSIAMHMADPKLFSKDLFVQDSLLMGINHRSFTALLIAFAGLDWIPWMAFLWFIGGALVLLSGMVKLASTYTQHPIIILLVILLTCWITYDLNLGGHDLYSNGFGGTLLAEGMLAWAWYFLIKKQYIKMSLLCVAATFAHPLEGVQFFAISTTVLFWMSLNKQQPFKEWWLSIPIFLFTAGVYVLYTLWAVSEGNDNVEMHIEMAYYFRNPHHFDVTAFSKKGALVMFILIIAGLPVIWKQNRLLAKACFIIIFGMMVYSFGTLVMKSHLVFNTEWFRTNIWLKFFLILALAKMLEPSLSGKWNLIRHQYVYFFSFILAIAVMFPVAEDSQFPWKGAQNPSQEIALKAKELLPINALVLHPLSVSDFRCFAERSSYVGMKAMPVRKQGMKIWYQRVKLAFGQHLGTGNYGFKMVIPGDQYLKHLQMEDLKILKKEGVTHLLTFVEVSYPDLRKLASNSVYALYEL